MGQGWGAGAVGQGLSGRGCGAGGRGRGCGAGAVGQGLGLWSRARFAVASEDVSVDESSITSAEVTRTFRRASAVVPRRL